METNPDFISRQVLSGDYYFLDTASPRDTVLAVVCGGRETCGQTYRIDRDGFPYESIEYIASGAGCVTLNGESFPVSAGTLFRYGPGVQHRIEVAESAVMVKYFVDFEGSAVPLLMRGPWQSSKPLQVPERAGIRHLFDELQRTGKGARINASRYATLLVEQIILRAEEEAVDSITARSESFLSFRRCKDFIELNFLQIGSLAQVALACNLGQAWLCRLFAQYDSETPYHFILKLKMNHAASLLADSARQVKQVAWETGFEDPCHFSKVFKKFYGVSPEYFRSANGRRRF